MTNIKEDKLCMFRSTLGTRINGQGRLFIFRVCAHPDDAYSVPPVYLFLDFFFLNGKRDLQE